MTPRGRRGLSPPPKQPEEASWMATIGPNDCENGLLWVVDSGCSRHMTFAREVFTEYRRLDSPIQVNTANGAQIQAIATGTVRLQVAIGSAVRRLRHGAPWVPMPKDGPDPRGPYPWDGFLKKSKPSPWGPMGRQEIST
jgi:hypothetical protein